MNKEDDTIEKDLRERIVKIWIKELEEENYRLLFENYFTFYSLLANLRNKVQYGTARPFLPQNFFYVYVFSVGTLLLLIIKAISFINLLNKQHNNTLQLLKIITTKFNIFMSSNCFDTSFHYFYPFIDYRFI